MVLSAAPTATVRASEESGNPGGGIGAPKDDAITFADLSSCQFASEAKSSFRDLTIGPACRAVAAALGVGLLAAEALEISQVISDIRSLHK